MVYFVSKVPANYPAPLDRFLGIVDLILGIQ